MAEAPELVGRGVRLLLISDHHYSYIDRVGRVSYPIICQGLPRIYSSKVSRLLYRVLMMQLALGMFLLDGLPLLSLGVSSV